MAVSHRVHSDAAGPRSWLAAAVRDATARLAPYTWRTPLVASPGLGSSVWLKCENMQRTGSFKLRGALNKLLLLTPEERERGIVTSSTGNHGLAVGVALQLTGGRGTAVLPSTAKRAKVGAIRRTGLTIELHGDDPMLAELHARQMAAQEGKTYVSPYNDLEVIAGQGTVATEFEGQLANAELVCVAVGGGGLISGVAAWLKDVNPAAVVVGCWPEHAAGMYESLRAGHIVAARELPTLSDGTAGNVEAGSITFPLCRDLIDDCVLVSENEIADGMRYALQQHHVVIEGAAGVAIAGYRRVASRYAGKRAVVVLCGGNIALDALQQIVSGAAPQDTPTGGA